MARFRISQMSVVPYVGTWIEMMIISYTSDAINVVPYVGTWIEIAKSVGVSHSYICRSLRGNVDRNSVWLCFSIKPAYVVPYVGTWIEILTSAFQEIIQRRSFPTWDRG